MRFLVRYKCKNCKQIIEREMKVVSDYEIDIPATLARYAEKPLIHPCAYCSWGVAYPYEFRQLYGDYDE